MSKIPIPLIVGIVVVAVIVLFFGIRSSGVLGGGEAVPSGPPKAAMQEYQKQRSGR